MRKHILAAVLGILLATTVLIIGGSVSSYICIMFFSNFSECSNNPLIEMLLLSFIVLAGVVFLIPYWLIFKENMPKFVRWLHELYNNEKDE